MDIATCHTFYNNNRLASSLVPQIGQRMDSKGAKLGGNCVLYVTIYMDPKDILR